MLSPRLTNCIECSTIPNLIENIDCKLAETATSLYYNTIYMLNRPVDGNVMIDLLNYRRILTFKYCNPDYGNSNTCDHPITMGDIISRVKILTLNCKRPDCTSTTTTTCPPTTTTTSSTSTSSTTTTTTTNL